jgi:glycine C-acetyltransferase
MDGDIAPLDKICELADKYSALVFIDECHATGFVGKTGRGTAELFGVSDRVDIINSTLGKALGGAAGGYTTASKTIVDLLRQRSRPYLFSNSLPPAVVGGASKVFDLISNDYSLLRLIESNTKYFRESIAKSGFLVKGHPSHPIVPVMIGDARMASNLADRLLHEGIYVVGFSYPVVPKGQARIRVQISSIHTKEQIDKAIVAFTKIGEELGLIPPSKLQI